MQPDGEIVINDDGMVKVDHLIICRVFAEGNVVKLEFHDRNKRRSDARGTNKVIFTLAELKTALDAQKRLT